MLDMQRTSIVFLQKAM